MKIDTNIPIPERATWKSQLDKLDVGQSFPFDPEDRATVSNTVSVQFHRLTKKKFTISDDPITKGMCRVWRTA